MRIVFMGTPEFAVPALHELNKHFKVVDVITQCDKPGNHRTISIPPVKKAAAAMGLKVFQFENINDHADTIKELNPDIIVTAAYGQILKKQILDIAPKGVLNIHASLLPKYRGASPISSVLMNGEKETGVTIMKTVSKLDAGDILIAEAVPIDENINASELTAKLAQKGAELIVKAINLIKEGKDTYTPQDESQATFCGKITSCCEKIEWNDDAVKIHNKVRALSPTGAWTDLNGARLKILETRVVDCGCDQSDTVPGEVIRMDKKEIYIKCGSGTLALKRVQLQCCKAMSAADFINGRKIAVGDILR